MPRKSSTDQELGWLRSVWEELSSAELKHAGFIYITVRASASRCRFYVKWEIQRPDTPLGLKSYHASQQLNYPCPDATQFLPWLWNMSRRFSEYIDNDDEDARPTLKLFD
jgi:hypothetical protein